MRVFLDANILFTAAVSPDGKSAYLINNARKAEIDIVTCTLAIEEADRNLQAKFPGKTARLSGLLTRISILPTAVSGDCPIRLPDKDIPIFLSALAGGATHLLTGDFKDFGPFMNKPGRTGKIVIQSVGDFLRSI
jgi:predicted nucleic acid-binding protein